MPTLAIIAALPRELTLLSRALRALPVSNRDGILLHSAQLSNDRTVLLVTAGMGSQRVALAVAAALAQGPVATLLSVGLAGACAPQLAPGRLLEATLVIDTQSGERFDPTAPFTLAARLGLASPGILATSPHIAGPAEKQRLHAAYNAAAVDMEAATIARLARAHSIHFAALKAISDDHAADLTQLSVFSNPRGHFRTAAFALHTALRPHTWRPTLTLGRNSDLALQALTDAVRQILGTPPA